MKHLLTALAVIVLVLFVSACNQAAEPAAPTPSAVETSSASGTQDIPVEALPDPLPEPYLFRDELTIELEPITETVYVIEPGDTLALVADQFCLTVAEIQRLNNIVDVTQISIGQELRIPIREGGCGAAAPVETGAEGAPTTPERVCADTYTVQPGNTLANIAIAYGLSWQEIAQYNQLSDAEANALQVGQDLCIPPLPEPEPEPAPEPEAEDSSNPEPPG